LFVSTMTSLSGVLVFGIASCAMFKTPFSLYRICPGNVRTNRLLQGIQTHPEHRESATYKTGLLKISTDVILMLAGSALPTNQGNLSSHPDDSCGKLPASFP